MASPDLELQGAIVARLKADATVAALIGTRVYDQPPTPVTYPYVTIGEAQFLRDDATCVSGGRTFLTLHTWSQAVGFPEVRRVADAVVESLHLAAITLPTNHLISIMHRQTRVFRDPDGLTSHAVIDLVANTEKPTA
ncbi:DUF3168 domain-containing protein [Rhizobium leguminosarum]|uniref:DUF3168 domain-containing protein n=1 Tax=Rhizobium leguminosarum TaxID=384 RepID=UPI0015DBBD1F|nr:DUF3168 domain-containing protein [Rhizobium leguminosarum]NZD50539.1 DUF3168 domain-containing protein [Rhizobium leguminosarum]